MAVTNQDIFQRCAPAIRTNIAQCGSVTLCESVKPATVDDLEDIYKKDGAYRILDNLFMTKFEIRACGSVQHSMRDFFIANARVAQKSQLRFDQNDRSLTKIAPFVLANQKIPRNNVYWNFTHGVAGTGSTWTGRVTSPTGIPNDIRSFPAGRVVWLIGLTGGGTKIKSQYVISDSVLSNDGTYILISLTPQNGGSLFPTASLANPVTATLIRGVVNVGKSESYCDDEPAYIDNKRVPFWMQHTRWTSCNSSLYEEWLGLVLNNNMLFEKDFYVSEVDRNKQMLEAFEDMLFNTFWYQAPISDKQNLTEYNELDPINNFLSDTGLGIEGGRCVGRRANAVGVLEQLRECSRWVDCQGAELNLISVFDAIYNMRRVRAGIGSNAQLSIDCFTDGITAELIDRAMIDYYGEVFNDKDRYTVSIDKNVTRGKNDEFGIQFTSYALRGRNNGVTWNVITDWTFDDMLSQFASQSLDGAGRTLMFLDLTGIYMSIVESTKQTNHVGDLKALAAVDPSYACVMETDTRDITLNDIAWATVVECPAANLIIDNFSADDISIDPDGRPTYGGTDSVTPYDV